MRTLSKRYNKMYLESYNKAADDMNKGGIEKFNSDQRKKYGANYAKRDGYVSDYDQMFSNRVAKYMNASLADFYKNDKNFKKSEQLVSKYNMTNWNELAMKNTAVVSELRSIVENDKRDD